MTGRGGLVMISPARLRHTNPSTPDRSAPHDFAASQSRTVYSYSRMATASSAFDIASVSVGKAETWRPTNNTCREGFAATREWITLTSFRILGVDVSQTTASRSLAVIRLIMSCTE